jgi:hypothetical protein
MQATAPSSNHGDDPVIRLEQLNRRYRMGAEHIDALGSVDLTVNRGD